MDYFNPIFEDVKTGYDFVVNFFTKENFIGKFWDTIKSIADFMIHNSTAYKAYKAGPGFIGGIVSGFIGLIADQIRSIFRNRDEQGAKWLKGKDDDYNSIRGLNGIVYNELGNDSKNRYDGIM